MSVIYLIRHGRTDANRKRLYCGATDVPLDAEGVSELQSLRDKGGYPPSYGLITITSGLKRAVQTFEVLFGKYPAAAVSGLREMDFGRFEMHSYDELKNDPDYQAWIKDETGDARCPGGESSNEFCRRVYAAFDALAAMEEDAVVVCHGGVISRIMARLFPGEGRNFYEWQPPAGHGYAITDPTKETRSFSGIPKQ